MDFMLVRLFGMLPTRTNFFNFHNMTKRLFRARAYCAKCGKLLLESNPFYKKELIKAWDKCVLDAPGIICRDCATTVPNFDITLKIYNEGSALEFDVFDIIPKPKALFPSVDDLVNSVKI